MAMEHGAVQFSPATSSPQGLPPQPSPTHVRIAPSRGNQQQKWEQAATGQEESCKNVGNARLGCVCQLWIRFPSAGGFISPFSLRVSLQDARLNKMRKFPLKAKRVYFI